MVMRRRAISVDTYTKLMNTVNVFVIAYLCGAQAGAASIWTVKGALQGRLNQFWLAFQRRPPLVTLPPPKRAGVVCSRLEADSPPSPFADALSQRTLHWNALLTTVALSFAIHYYECGFMEKLRYHRWSWFTLWLLDGKLNINRRNIVTNYICV